MNANNRRLLLLMGAVAAAAFLGGNVLAAGSSVSGRATGRADSSLPCVGVKSTWVSRCDKSQTECLALKSANPTSETACLSALSEAMKALNAYSSSTNAATTSTSATPAASGGSASARVVKPGRAGGALAGFYPNPTLNVTGGDKTATTCKNGEAVTGLSTGAALTCGLAVYSDKAHNVDAGPTTVPGGQGNDAFGHGAGASGVGNSAFGDSALNTDQGAWNTAFGFAALGQDTTGSSNTALGSRAGNISTGSDNIAIGANAGTLVTTTSNNVDIANQGVAGDSGVIRIGTAKNQTSAYLAGVSSVSIPGPTSTVLVNASGQLGTATSSLSSEKMNIEPLSALARLVLDLRPVSYRYKPRYASAVNPTQYGLIAEQVGRILPALVQHGSRGQATGVYYQELPVLLLGEIQRQQRQIDQLEAQNRRINTLQAEVDALIRQKSKP